MVVITRWSHKQRGHETGFHCTTNYGPTVVALTRFHCSRKELGQYFFISLNVRVMLVRALKFLTSLNNANTSPS